MDMQSNYALSANALLCVLYRAGQCAQGRQLCCSNQVMPQVERQVERLARVAMQGHLPGDWVVLPGCADGVDEGSLPSSCWLLRARSSRGLPASIPLLLYLPNIAAIFICSLFIPIPALNSTLAGNHRQAMDTSCSHAPLLSSGQLLQHLQALEGAQECLHNTGW